MGIVARRRNYPLDRHRGAHRLRCTLHRAPLSLLRPRKGRGARLSCRAVHTISAIRTEGTNIPTKSVASQTFIQTLHSNLFQNGTSCLLTITRRSKLRFKSRCIPAVSIFPQAFLSCMVSQRTPETGPAASSLFVSAFCNTALPPVQGSVIFRPYNGVLLYV